MPRISLAQIADGGGRTAGLLVFAKKMNPFEISICLVVCLSGGCLAFCQLS